MKILKRNDCGLIDGLEYKFNSDSTINWRAMIESQFLYPNKEVFQKRGELVPDKIDGLKDSDLVISLGGLKTLGGLRGYTSITYRPIVASSDYCATVCSINFVGNYETGMISITFEECGSANLFNTSELVQTYLLEIATNRAFCRCVRNFLKINIVSKEELPPLKKKSLNGAVSKLNPSVVLADYMKGKGRSFEETKKKLMLEGQLEFESYKDWTDVPGDVAFKLIERFKNLKEVKR